MGKIFVVARTEFGNAVRSKAFLVSLLMLPLIYGIMIFVQIYANKSDVEPRKFAVIDRTGKLYPADQDGRRRTTTRTRVRPTASPTRARVPARGVQGRRGGRPAEATVALSDRVRAKELFAFIEIPADATEPKVGAAGHAQVLHAQPQLSGTCPAWLDAVVGRPARRSDTRPRA